MKRTFAIGFLLFIFLGVAAPPAFAWTQVAEKQLAYQPQDEIEPALIAYTNFGVEYVASVWMNFDPNINTPSTLHYTAWTVGGNSLTTTGTIPTVAGYSRYADPVLVKHPTLNRIFLVAVARNDAPDPIDPDLTVTRTAIVVWYSNNAGWDWSSGRVVASDSYRSDSTAIDLDKPVAATGPDGRLWVSYIRGVGNTNYLLVRNGTASGSPLTWSWSSASTVTSGAPSAPQIAVDSNGDVYVLATRSTGSIGFWRDDAQDANGVSFAALPFIPNVGTLYRTSPASDLNVGSGVIVRAVTVPIMKLDRAHRRISVVWHESNGAGATRLQYAVWRLDTAVWSNVTFAAGGGVHHINVGLDYDAAGNVLVTWYRFGGSSTYTNAGKFVTFDANHNPQWVSDNAITNRLGDAANLTADGTGRRYIGEYHEVSYTNNKFYAAHIVAVLPWSDPWVFTVSQP